MSLRPFAAATAALALAACHGEYDPPDPGLRVLGGPLALTEAGGTATFTVALAIAPQADVDVDVLAGDASEGLVAADGDHPAAWTTLRFGPSDWEVARTVTVSAVDDVLRDGDVAWAVRLLVAASADAAYAAAPGATVDVVTRDDDTPAIRVSRTTVFTAETGAVADAFEVSLASQPSGVVTVPVSSGDTSEGLVSGGPHGIAPAPSIDLVFTPSSWDVPQAVTVTAADDDVVDGGQVYAITVGPSSGDPDYAALAPRDVVAVNADDDVADVLVAGEPVVVAEGGSGGFQLRLASRPAEPVQVPVVSGDPGEVSLSASEWATEGQPSVAITFAPESWNVAQWVWTLGIVDYAVDGDQTVAVAVGPPTGDPLFASAPQRTIPVTVVDGDRPAAVLLEPAAARIREGYRTGFWASLSTPPSAPVTLRLASPDTAEALVSCNTADASDATSVTVRFDHGYPTMHWVEVLAVDDAVASGDTDVAITVEPQSADPRFAALPPKTFTLTVLEDELPAILASHSGLALVEGGSAALAVALARAPAVDVVVPVASSDPAEALLSAGGSAPAPSVALTFTPATWAAPQEVTVLGVDDAMLEPDPPHPFTISIGPATSAGPYAGVAGPSFPGTTTDDEPFPTEGTPAAPVELADRLPWPGTVGVGTSWYRLEGFGEGGIVTVRGANAALSVSVLEDTPERAEICPPRSAVPHCSCAVRLPPGGSFLVRADGSSTARGSTFTIDAAPFAFAPDPPLAIPDGPGAGPLQSELVVSGVPAGYATFALLVYIAHPRVADLDVFVLAPPHLGWWQVACSGWYAGADYDRTVLLDDPALPYVCGASPPFAGTFRPATSMPHPSDADVNGTWGLLVRDNVTGEWGTLVRWGLAAR